MNRRTTSFFLSLGISFGLGSLAMALPVNAGQDAKFTAFELQRPAGSEGAYPNAMSRNGQIVGFWRDVEERDRACVWKDRNAAPISLKQTKEFDHYAYSCNDSGAIVGEYSTVLRDQACYWESPTAVPIELESPRGALSTTAYGISPSGQIVGRWKSISGEKRACLWPESGAEPISLKTPSGASSYAYSINADGAIVGYIRSEDGKTYACLWPSAKAKPVALLAPTGAEDYWANLIDDDGRIAGYFSTDRDGEDQPCIWESKSSRAEPVAGSTDLEKISAVSPSGWLLGHVTVGEEDCPCLWTWDKKK